MTWAGTYHPATSISSLIEPNGLGITITIDRAELDSITAAIFMATHVLPQPLVSPSNQEALAYPELHCHHLQGNILKMLIQAVHNSPNSVHLSYT